MISLATVADIEEIKKIHSEYFESEFTLEDLLDPHTMRAWVIREEGIICAGALRPILEATLITNKSFPAERRRVALLQMMQTMKDTCTEFNFQQLHAFIQDEKWLRHLKSVGFHPTKGEALVLNI